MKKGLVVLIFLSIVCSFSSVLAQNSKVDSLKKVLARARQDTARIEIYNQIGDSFLNVNLDSSLFYFSQVVRTIEHCHDLNKVSIRKNSLQHAKAERIIGAIYTEKGDYKIGITYLIKSIKEFQALDDQKMMAVAYRNLGVAECELGNFDSAIYFYTNSLNISRKLDFGSNVASNYINLGNVYYYQGIFDKAEEFYFKALKINEQLKNQAGVSSSYTNLGGVFYSEKNYKKAIDFYTRSLQIDSSLNDRSGMSIDYSNIGLAYSDLNQYKKSIFYYLKSLKISEELGEESGLIDVYNNLGLAYKEIGDFHNAIHYYTQSLRIAKKLSDKNGLATAQVNLSDIYVEIAQKSDSLRKIHYLEMALKFGKSALVISRAWNLMQLENFASKSLMGAYKEQKNWSEAYRYAEVYIATNDSLFSTTKTKAIAEMEAKYQNEKKQKEIEILEKDNTISEEKAHVQKIIILSISIGLLLLVFMITFILRRLQITRRQKRIIEEKNSLLNEKNEEISAQRDEIESQRDLVVTQRDRIETQSQKITDSITYAQRIQQAVLPSGNAIEDILGDHFILFKPKDIVSGDFYWATRSNEHLFVAVADCTGHGVPGAFMSMLGITLLNEIVRRKENFNAAEVLDRLRELMIEALKQKGIIGEQKDGMDMAFCILNTKTNTLQYAGANISLNIVSVNRELTVIGADKQPVAIFVKMKPFTNHDIPLSKGDCIYLASDGFKDQFGGPQGKKYMVKRFSELLMSIAEKPMEEQRQLLDQTFESWRGDQEQVDDLTILGVRV
ncbi:MAG TPA: tetratricopeptide repeat protein [Williamwhitmania sp.]|nr:tetratricopeptide repeat protein [Williamwhitmania sp.]